MDNRNRILNIERRITPHLTEGARHFVSKKFNSAIITYILGGHRYLCLCQYVGMIFNKKKEKLTVKDYRYLATFINKAYENKLFLYGTLGDIQAIDLSSGRTLVKIYAFSNFNLCELNTIIKYGLGINNIYSFPEGGLPEERYRPFQLNNIYHNILNENTFKNKIKRWITNLEIYLRSFVGAKKESAT